MHKCVDTEKLLVVVQGRHGLLGSSCTSIVFTGHWGTPGDTGDSAQADTALVTALISHSHGGWRAGG